MRLCFVCAFFLVLAGPAALAQEPAEQVTAPPIRGFKLANQDIRPDRRVYELIPENETLQTWSERAAIIVFEGVKERDPVQVATRLQEEWRSRCADFGSHAPEPLTTKGYPTTMITMQCRDPKPAPPGSPLVLRRNEFVMIKILQGKDNLYLVQRAWHSDSETVPPPVRDARVRDAWIAYFRQVEVCDPRVAGQACTAQRQKH